ncbi:hypothetical protein TNCV_796081 [Trichonephila clavipes]|nr:hypothetical protein TNCV_796081 [Trichonephila clavipes]
MPPNTLRVHTEYILDKSVGPKVLWGESRVQGIGEYCPPLESQTKIVEVEIGGYRPLGEFDELIRTVTYMVRVKGDLIDWISRLISTPIDARGALTAY